MKFPGLRIGTTVDHAVGTLTTRQYPNSGDYSNYDDGYISFWYTKTGIIVKWCLFLAILTLFFAYMILGRMHANKRIARGLPPLAYHRWLVSRRQLAAADPRYAYPQPAGFSTYRPPQQHQQADGGYGMDAMPPPVYDPTAPRPPMYSGAPGQEPHAGAKIDPDQGRAGYQQPPGYQPPRISEEFDAPAGPPPGAVKSQGTGSSNPFRG